MKNFLDVLKEKIIVFDGATGTHLQGQNLTADDFGGEHLNGCNEYLVVSKPSAVELVHSDYLEAGADVIETNSFGSASIVLAEYDLADKAYELSLKSAQIAKRVASDFSTADRPRFVAGSMGPTTKLPSLGHIKFKDMAMSYKVQAKGLVEGGADLLCIETCQDVLQAKAALYGIFEYFEEAKTRVPIITSVTVETMGTLLLGTEISAALTSLEPYDIDVLGMNCATGPAEMSEHIRALCSSSPKPVFVMPNAGIPENVGGHAHYKLTPEELAQFMTHFVKDLGVNVVGGCCGTTKEHIRQLANAVGGLAPKKREIDFIPSASSLYQSAPLTINPPPVLIGERTNANGSKLFKDLLAKEDWEGIVAMGREAVKEGAHMVDVCAAYVGRDEVKDMKEIIYRFNTQVQLPIVIDSTEANVIEESLQLIGGKAIVNSINLEDGEKRIDDVVPLCKKYGAAVIALTIDEQGSKPVIRVGRFAGQYAKPRSEDFETRDGVTLPSYRGDLVNHIGFTPAERTPDPQLLLRAHGRAALTLNFIRSLVKGGFADLHHPEYWDLDWVGTSPLAGEYRRMVKGVSESLRFLENVLGIHAGEIERVDFFTSHEGLHLAYEEAQTRRAERSTRWYNLSTHFPWIGMRTSGVEGAHVEHFRGIANPIALKVGPAMTPAELVRLLDVLHPDNEPGRLTLVHRFGCHHVAHCLPPLIDAVRASGKTVLWCSDPMHGNTRLTADGVKTRRFEEILSELEQSFDIHAAAGSRLCGVHFEMAGEDVTECIGGARGLTEQDLGRAYKSEVDPRLNYEQALEMAMLIARRMAASNGG